MTARAKHLIALKRPRAAAPNGAGAKQPTGLRPAPEGQNK